MSEVNVTPLIDLAFSLLIIFMITAPLLEQSIELELPLESQSPQPELKKEEFQTISINRKGEYFWGSTPVSLAKMESLIEEIALKTTPPVFNLRADRSVPYQGVITVIDLLKQL